MTEEATALVNGVPCVEVFRYSLRESDKVFQLDVELLNPGDALNAAGAYKLRYRRGQVVITEEFAGRVTRRPARHVYEIAVE